MRCPGKATRHDYNTILLKGAVGPRTLEDGHQLANAFSPGSTVQAGRVRGYAVPTDNNVGVCDRNARRFRSGRRQAIERACKGRSLRARSIWQNARPANFQLYEEWWQRLEERVMADKVAGRRRRAPSPRASVVRGLHRFGFVPFALVAIWSCGASIPIPTGSSPFGLLRPMRRSLNSGRATSFSDSRPGPHYGGGVRRSSVLRPRPLIGLLSGPRRATLLVALFTIPFLPPVAWFVLLPGARALAERGVIKTTR